MAKRRLDIDTHSSTRKLFRHVGIPSSFVRKLEAKMEETRRKPNALTAKQQRKLTYFASYVLAAAILGWEKLKTMDAEEIVECLERCP